MGILNVTPDSFSDGNRFLEHKKAIDRVKSMIDEGVDIIDIGGESTRPSSQPVLLDEELVRVIPLIQKMRKFTALPISIDTRKAEVAKQAIESGANIINDISALHYDPLMVEVVNAHPEIAIVLMHMQGQPATMQDNPVYSDVVKEVYSFLEKRLSFCRYNGIDENRVMVDPGIGFGKTLTHNLRLLGNLDYFMSLDVPVVLGASRKRFISSVDESKPDKRLGGSLAAACAALDGGVDIIRVHDVQEHVQFIKVYKAIRERRGL